MARLTEGLELLISTRYGSAVVADVLGYDDVTIAFTDEIGVELPNGHVITTGGTAMAEGRRVYLSRQHYGQSSPAVLSAMLGHELTHVAQNIASGTAWWQWPWTTIDREITAHLVQAVVWAEVRGDERDWEQDRNLENALTRENLRSVIKNNPAYPWWLSPNISC